jgi:hypothetical protein
MGELMVVMPGEVTLTAAVAPKLSPPPLTVTAPS